MRDLTNLERAFLEGLLKYSSRIIAGYYRFQPRNKIYGNTKYKRSRVVMQLHLNKLLEKFEIVHHKDGNKLNDSITNLEVQTFSQHNSNHHSGSIKIGHYSPSNKLTQNKVNKIIKLSKIITKKNGYPNYEKIGRELNISGFTVSKYLKG